MLLCCTITNRHKGYPFKDTLPSELGITGVVLSDQVKSLDWHVREAAFMAHVPDAIITDALAKLDTLLS